MGNIWIIARREYKHYFVSPIAFVFLFVMLLWLGAFLFLDILYSLQVTQYVPDFQQTLSRFEFPILFLGVPALTMATMAEENRMGTLELLLTAPIRDWELIVGKWLGTFLFLLTAIALTIVYPIVLNSIVNPGIDQGLMVAGYIGIILLSAAMSAIGVFISSLFKNQIAALMASFGIMIFFWVVSAGAQFTSGTIADILRYLSLTEHLNATFFAGIVNIPDVIYYISMTALSLFLGSISVESRRWR